MSAKNAEDFFKSNVKNFFDDLTKEHNTTVKREWSKVLQSEPGSKKVDGKISAIPSNINDYTLRITYSGQKFWNLEFGKGEGTGLPATVGASVSQMRFLSSRVFHSYYRNPARSKGRKEKVYTGERTQPYPVYVKNKKGTRFTRHITRRKYVMKPINTKDALLRIYSRPDGYTDLDGVYHTSEAIAEFWVERPVKRGEQRPALSMRGAFALQRFWGYDFVKEKTINNKLQETKAYKTFEENLVTDIEEYLFGK